MSSTTCQITTPSSVWSPAETLSPRVRQLREEFWNFYTRDYTNEVRAFSTGTYCLGPGLRSLELDWRSRNDDVFRWRKGLPAG